MLADESLRATFRHFYTLFLIVGVLTVPAHIGHAYVFRDVVAVADLHRDIEGFPEGRQVQSVGVSQLKAARTSALVLSLVELALVPLMLRAARRAVSADREVTTVAGAYRGVLRSAARKGSLRDALPWLAGAALLGIATGLLLRAAGLLLIEPLPDARAFPWAGLVEGTARAVGGAFFLGPAAYVTRRKDT
jgi:hypothetical protein